MEIAARQRRDLAKMREDSRQASTSIHTDIQSRMSKKPLTLLDLCVSSLRRAMLIFSVLFQFYRMIPEGNPLGSE